MIDTDAKYDIGLCNMLKTNNLNVKKMTVGQMANLNHVSEQTLRCMTVKGCCRLFTGMRRRGTGIMISVKAPNWTRFNT